MEKYIPFYKQNGGKYNCYQSFTEEAISAFQAADQNLAFTALPKGNYIRGYLYKPGKNLKTSTVIGFAEMSKDPENPYNAFTLERTAAEKGYGPLLYDIMLSIADKNQSPIQPDRYSVSKFARKVWQYYHDRRKDVVYQPIDDKENPLTKTKKDDGEVHYHLKTDDISKRDVIDYVYWINKPINYKNLIQNHTKFINNLNISKNSLQDFFHHAGEAFFHEMYGRNY